jgi:hypothetical protein
MERKSKYLKSYTAGWYSHPFFPLSWSISCTTGSRSSSRSPTQWIQQTNVLRHLLIPLSRYVLSPTHLHEFKSADKSGAPVMSLYLPEQKLGSHSNEGGSSNKFMLKGRQTGSMHRGHSWVFRCESFETMSAW